MAGFFELKFEADGPIPCALFLLVPPGEGVENLCLLKVKLKMFEFSLAGSFGFFEVSLDFSFILGVSIFFYELGL